MKTLLRMVVPFAIKAADPSDPNARTFEGLSAIWTEDLGRDIIHKGAFAASIAAWKAKGGEAIPLLNSHDHWDIFSAVGQLLDAKELPEGLWTKWEVIEGEDGDRVLTRLRPSTRTGRAPVSKLSIGYDPTRFDFIEDEKGNYVRNLYEVEWCESSLVLFPMAPGASIDATSVKSFLESTRTSDPTKLTVDTKQELRRLASRIGTLLSGKKIEGAEPAAAEFESIVPAAMPVVQPSPTPNQAPGKAPVVPVVAEPEETTETTEEGDEEDDVAEIVTAAVVAAEPEGKGAYLYDEALQQRMRKVLLKTKASSITNPLPE